MMKGKIAYVKLDRFSRDAGRELRWTLDELITQQPVSAVILDLRGNPGGLLEAAVRVCELFLPRNSLIVSTRDRMGRLREYRSEREPLLADLPLVVLIDKFSASASEIVAGAIQDHDRGVIIGRRSFGKGLVQTVVPLPHEASLKMTTARYYTPSGRCIQKLYRPDPTQDSSGTFVTRNGRLMRPSSGIYPDIELTQAPYPGCVDELVTSWTIGEFATRVTSAISALSPDFRVDRSLMKQFYAFVDSLPAQRRSRQELRLQSVLDELQADGAPKDVVRSVRTALAALKADRMRELQGQSTVIGQLIDAEIRARFGTEADRERQLLSIDDAVSTALEVVNSGRYSTVLEATALSD
jgi:carboxyl-terminal processing protease